MTLTTSQSYQLPAQVSMQASLANNFVAFHRFPDQFSFSTGTLAAAANVNLIVGTTEFRIVVLSVFAAFSGTNRLALRDGTTEWLAVRSNLINFFHIDMIPYGKVLGNGANLNMINTGAASADYDVTVFYTFERV